MTRVSNLRMRLVAGVPTLRRTVASALCLGAALCAWTSTAAAQFGGGGGCVPTIELTSPVEGTVAAAPATFTLTAAAGGCSIGRVVFKANGVLVKSDGSAPFTYTWESVPAGYYIITATAEGMFVTSTTSAPVHVISDDGTMGGGGNVAPTVTLSAPADGDTAIAPASVTLRAIASDYDGTVAWVEFWSNGALLGTDTEAPYRWPLSGLAAGTYEFKAVAVDELEASTTSAQKTFLVTGTAPPPPPPEGTVGVLRSYVYDDNMRLCRTINPESGATIVDYDVAGNIAWSADGLALTSTTSCDRASVPASAKTTRTYDARNRLLTVVTPGGTANVTTEYAPDGAVTKLIAANPGGNTVTTTYSYNKRRLLAGETSSNGATLYALGYGYTANGHLGELSYPDGQTVSYLPDALGRATKVGVTGGTTYASGISYYPSGAISGFTYGNGIVHTLTQNTRRLPARSRDLNGATAILDDGYAFDENGNVLDITDLAQAGKTTRGMAYDGLDRLTAAISPGQWGDALYSYDALDNLRSADQGTRQYRYNYDEITNRLTNIKDPAGVTKITLGYDAQGNTTSKVGTTSQTFVFDSASRLNQVTGQQTYRYDGQGRRVQTTDSDGKTTFWIYSQSGQVLYTSEARRNQNLSYLYLGNTQVATRAVAFGTGVPTIRYQHTDALGSIVAETNASGVVTKRNSYAPYGEAYAPTVIDGTGYTGHVMDQATGLTYMQQRYYDPQIGRFLSNDPIPTDPNSGSNFNRYNYANNNPYRFSDPDGRWAEDLFLGVPSLVMGASNLVDNIGQGNVGAAVADGLGIVADVVAIATPGVPGGAGMAITAVRAADKAADAAKISGKAQVTRAAGKETTHASTSARIAGEQAARTDATSVHLNQTISTVTGKDVKSSLRPDVATVRTDGKVDVTEVLSSKQEAGATADKYRNALGDKAGKITCVPADKC